MWWGLPARSPSRLVVVGFGVAAEEVGRQAVAGAGHVRHPAVGRGAVPHEDRQGEGVQPLARSDCMQLLPQERC